MSEKGSVFQKGGGGTNFEQAVQTAFIVTLITRGNVPGIPSGEISEIAFQVTNRRYETDDLMVIVNSLSGKHRLLIQVKHDISFAPNNEQFKKVIKGFWKDYNNSSIFDKTKDKLIIVKNGLTKDERNHLKSLFNWARNHATETDFITEVNRIKGKKKRLDIFREVLKEANDNIALNDKELWEFLRCVDVLEYDFLNENSVDLTYFLNLIKLSKNKRSTLTEKEIWDSIVSYVSALNPNGGNVTLESIKNEEFFRHFDNAQLSPYIKSVEKLKSDSQEILRPIKTFIGKGEKELKFPRIEEREKIIQAINTSQITIVTGKPGAGKSSIVKELIQKDFSDAAIFVFRADQFNEPTLANVLSSQGINETIQDIFSCISLFPEKIIFIDSLEKLLESDPECAFNQLLAILKEHPEIKVIATSRKYAIDLITLKFGIDNNATSIIEIPTLNDAELKLVSEKFPQLKSVLLNKEIKELLRSPKYLDFSIASISKTNEEFANISLTEFKDKLWNSLVVDSTHSKNGLPIKREEAFMEIAVKRAKEMKLFVKPEKADPEAIIRLENDEIIFQEKNNRKYSPTHDILEDWALVKYISAKFEEFPNPKDFFQKIGNEPAIRRAFRLWIEDFLIDKSERINELIRITISDESIEKYWADELLTAIFRSENSNAFFSTFEKELLANDAGLLNRSLHIIKTTCKESYHNLNILLPIGSGWREALFFIKKHIVDLGVIKHSIVNFITDWYYRLLFQYDEIGKEELEAAKYIVLYFLKEIESGDKFLKSENAGIISKNLISILFGLAEISKEEIKQLLARAFANFENRESWRLNEFYKNVIESCLSGIGNQRLIKELPELIIETAWKYWKYIPPKEEDFADNGFRIFSTHSLHDEECWGIKNKHTFFPSGIYKTPFYNLLRVHPKIGLKFIVDFINYAVEFYVNSACKHKHKFSQIEIELNDGTKVKLWGSLELWLAYRGTSVTHYLLESLLMSLEKFLLELAKQKTEISKKNLKFIFDYIYKNSNNVAPLGVLTSISIAYPEEVDEAMLPLLSVLEFYEWDMSRALKEHSALAPMDKHISFAQKERWRSNQLPHRKKYIKGLIDFVITYQFNIRKINSQIHNLFDKLHASLKEDDIKWKKILSEIDIRKWEVKPYDKKLGGFIVQPKYEEDVIEFLNKDKDGFAALDKSISNSHLLIKAYENKEAIEYDKWEELFKYFSETKGLIYFDRPVTFAVLGLRDFSDKISEEQKEWCINTIKTTIYKIIQDKYSRNYGLKKDYNPMEEQVALTSYHLLMQNAKDNEDKDEIIAMMISMIVAPFADFEIKEIVDYVKNIFFIRYPNEAKRIWLGLIKYSNFKKTIPKFYGYPEESVLKELQKKEEEFIQQISSDKNLKLDISEINLEKSDINILARALLLLPYNSKDENLEVFIKHFVSLLITDLQQEENYSFPYSNGKRQIHYQYISYLEFYLAELLLKANPNLAKDILDLITEPIYQSDENNLTRQSGLFKFSANILEFIIYKLDEIVSNTTDEESIKIIIENFRLLWEHLYDKIKASGKYYFLSTLFLDIKWKETTIHWKPLENMKDFYHTIVKNLGKYKMSSIIKVFSTIGAKTFLPDSISWLVEIFKSEPKTISALNSRSAERMIKLLYFNHISKIKNDKKLIDDYIWILNQMVNLGSSIAYLLRENVITYKKTES